MCMHVGLFKCLPPAGNCVKGISTCEGADMGARWFKGGRGKVSYIFVDGWI